jgi:UDP-N-acetylglucosamine--N-acetylmuramyl-(pentapeptide) pyrophosphoryl-undecaprenol N-acetylglucosamine transferase
MNRVLIMAGGTGGHVYPGLAVARALQKDGIDVVWMGTRHGLEAKVIPEAGIDLEFITIRGIKGRGWLQWILMPMRITIAFGQAVAIIRRRRPTMVLSMATGYP